MAHPPMTRRVWLAAKAARAAMIEHYAEDGYNPDAFTAADAKGHSATLEAVALTIRRADGAVLATYPAHLARWGDPIATAIFDDLRCDNGGPIDTWLFTNSRIDTASPGMLTFTWTDVPDNIAAAAATLPAPAL